MFVDEEINYSFNCDISFESGDCTQKFIGTGCYEYVVAKKLQNGDK